MITVDEIRKNYKEGNITIRKHPFVDLYILNYTKRASKKAIWNEVTLNSRGLIINKRGKVVAFPFRKFFEIEHLPKHLLPTSKPIKVYEKLDGALGIMYWYNSVPYISTRGSFTSYQAIRATEILHNKYRNHFTKLNQNYTYLFEIIFPENRVVVDYGDTEDLFLIGLIDNATQKEFLIDELNDKVFPTPKVYDNNIELQKLIEFQEAEEGYVVLFKNDFRVKIKSNKYRKDYEFYTLKIKDYRSISFSSTSISPNTNIRMRAPDKLLYDFIISSEMVLLGINKQSNFRLVFLKEILLLELIETLGEAITKSISDKGFIFLVTKLPAIRIRHSP